LLVRREIRFAVANVRLDAGDLLSLGIGKPIAAAILPLHFKQDFGSVLLAGFGPVPNAFDELFEIFGCHGLSYSKLRGVRHREAPPGVAEPRDQLRLRPGL
jgi:hypothetical protein